MRSFGASVSASAGLAIRWQPGKVGGPGGRGVGGDVRSHMPRTAIWRAEGMSLRSVDAVVVLIGLS
jgi:hypothetical protein